MKLVGENKTKFWFGGQIHLLLYLLAFIWTLPYCKSFSKETPLIHWCCCMLRSFTYFIWFSAWFSFLNFSSVLMQAPQMWADLLILKRKEKKEHLCAFSNDLKKNLNFSSWLDQIFFWLLLLFPDLPSLIYFFLSWSKMLIFCFFSHIQSISSVLLLQSIAVFITSLACEIQTVFLKDFQAVIVKREIYSEKLYGKGCFIAKLFAHTCHWYHSNSLHIAKRNCFSFCIRSSKLISIFLPAAFVKALVERHFQWNAFINASINGTDFLGCRFGWSHSVTQN